MCVALKSLEENKQVCSIVLFSYVYYNIHLNTLWLLELNKESSLKIGKEEFVSKCKNSNSNTVLMILNTIAIRRYFWKKGSLMMCTKFSRFCVFLETHKMHVNSLETQTLRICQFTSNANLYVNAHLRKMHPNAMQLLGTKIF